MGEFGFGYIGSCNPSYFISPARSVRTTQDGVGYGVPEFSFGYPCGLMGTASHDISRRRPSGVVVLFRGPGHPVRTANSHVEIFR